MRIVHVAWGFRPWRVGGLIAYAEDLAAAQAELGHEVHLFCAGRHFPLTPRARVHTWGRGAMTVHELVNGSVIPGLEAGTQRPLMELDEPGSEAAWVGVLDELRPDVVHVHELLGLPSAVIERARERGVPVVMSLHDYQSLCPTLKLYDVDERRCLRPDVGAQCARCCGHAPHDRRHLVRMTLVHHALGAAARLGPLQRPLQSGWRQVLALRRRRAPAGAPSPPPPAAAAAPSDYQRRRDVNVARLSGVDRLL